MQVDEGLTTARRAAAVLVHYGAQQRTTRAVINLWNLRAFSDVVVVANDLTERPSDLTTIPCRWVVPSRNIGFGSACQLGALTCHADVYAFFNAHVLIDKSSVEQCLSAFDLDDVGIVNPYVHHPGKADPVVDSRNSRCTRTYSPILRLPIQVPFEKNAFNGEADTGELLDNDWATGGAIFCREQVIRDVGWDGSYFLGFEDVDISIRAKKQGWRVVVVPSATAVHSGESTRTSTASAYYAMRNALWFIRRYHDRRLQAMLTGYLLLGVCRIAAADALKKRRPGRVKPAVRGIADGWRLSPVGHDALPGEPLWASAE